MTIYPGLLYIFQICPAILLNIKSYVIVLMDFRIFIHNLLNQSFSS